MSENAQAKISSEGKDNQGDKKETIPHDVARKSLIDLKRIQNDSNKQQGGTPRAAADTPSAQSDKEKSGTEQGSGFGDVVNQHEQDERQLSQFHPSNQNNSINMNFQNLSSFSPRKGEHNSSLSPKKRIPGGSNTPCMSPLPDVKVQRSKYDISQTQFFITNINAFRGLESFPKINELHNQISSVIDDLEGKVDTVVERHEAEFLFAYRNHMTKIKSEMVDMKKQAEEQEKRLNDNDRVAGLERQIVWLRDECLNLYKILGKKKDDLTARERTIRDIQRDNQHLQNQIKELMKKNKLLSLKVPGYGMTSPTQYDVNNTQQSILNLPEQIVQLSSAKQSPKASQQQDKKPNSDENNQIEQQQQYNEIVQYQQQQQQSPEDDMYITQNIQIITQGQQNNNNQTTFNSPTNVSSKRASLFQSNPIQGTQNYQQAVTSFEQIISKHQIAQIEEGNPEYGSQIIALVKKNIEGEISVFQLINEISYFCKIVTDRKQKQYKQVKDKLDKTLKEKLKMGMARSDLESFFLECVETARKQIIKRKYVAGGTSNQNIKSGGQQGNGANGNPNSIFQSPQTNAKNMSEFIESIKDYKVFRNEDKVKILELLLSHEKLMMFLYQKIFPTHFNLHLQNALENQEEVPVYLRKTQMSGNKYININDNSIFAQPNKNQENYLDLLTEEDPSVQSYQDNIIYQNANSKSHEFQTRLPSIQEAQPQFNSLYSVNLKKKRSSVDQRSAYDSTANNSIQDNSTARYSVQISKLGALSNKYSSQRNQSMRNSNRSGSNYDITSDSRYRSGQKNVESNSFEDSRQVAYNILSQQSQSDAKRQNVKISYSAQKQKQNNSQILSSTSPLTNTNINSQQENRIIPDKLNIVNGKLVFKNI